MGYSLKTLPNGIPVVDGKILSWVFKLKSIDKEAPVFTFFRDLMMFDKPGEVAKVNKTAAAINHWMLYDKTDLPLAITQASFASYTIPITEDGTLPVKLFNRALNLKRFKEKNIPWLICVCEKDDLVDAAASLAPLDWVDAEVTVFPKGHTAMATSWSLPTSECALDSCFSHQGSGAVPAPMGNAGGRSGISWTSKKPVPRHVEKDQFMDRQFLEFWGNFLLSAAKSQKQLEDMTEWMKGGLKGFEELTSLFRKIYGLGRLSKKARTARKPGRRLRKTSPNHTGITLPARCRL